mgnify:CR=1 FL=1
MLMIHRPSPLMHPDEIAEAFNQLRAEGKVRYFGVSNFTVPQFEMLQSRITLMTNQVEASILHLPPFLDGTFDQCLKKRISPMVWSPLGGGNLFTEQGEIRIQRINFLIEALNRPKRMDLLFRASDHFFRASSFHAKCDNKANTVVLVRTEFGKTIGGFTT